MPLSSFRYFLLNKPYGMESQFVSPYAGPLLGDLSFDFPEGIHAIGRLDKHSEGLLLLTTNKKVTSLLFQGKVKHKRTYQVQVKHVITEESLCQLRTGIPIRIKGGAYYTTPPCEVALAQNPQPLFPSPVTFHANQATSWLQITLTEGKYHQVRKMVAKAGHRCLRLIRVSIEDLLLGDLEPGKIIEIDESAFFDQLKLDRSSIDNLI
ncbi:MAG TPA: pseudouridine synthase [Flavisolibacter sp.]|jgi:23S rRNA pseudouridine2457 synthase|nr:pseudouridine synthase [Flavisolibacter sp.]